MSLVTCTHCGESVPITDTEVTVLGRQCISRCEAPDTERGDAEDHAWAARRADEEERRREWAGVVEASRVELAQRRIADVTSCLQCGSVLGAREERYCRRCELGIDQGERAEDLRCEEDHRRFGR